MLTLVERYGVLGLLTVVIVGGGWVVSARAIKALDKNSDAVIGMMKEVAKAVHEMQQQQSLYTQAHAELRSDIAELRDEVREIRARR